MIRNHEIEKLYMEQIRNIETAIYILNERKNSIRNEMQRLRIPRSRPNQPFKPYKPDTNLLSIIGIVIVNIILPIIYFKVCGFIGDIFTSHFFEVKLPSTLTILTILFSIWCIFAVREDHKNYSKQMKKYDEEMNKYYDKIEKNRRIDKSNYDYSFKLEGQIWKIDEEIEKASKIRSKLYSINWIPIQYRNIRVAYYICDIVTTSTISIDEALKYYLMQETNNKLDVIINKLDNIIDNQNSIIINQAVTQAQNQRLISSNKSMLSRLASIESNSRLAADYSEISARYSEANAYFSLATYFKQ